MIRNKSDGVNFINYIGGFGLHDCMLNIHGVVKISGFINCPTYIRTSEDVNLTVSPNINLSVRSWSEGGAVDGHPLLPGTSFHNHGKLFVDYAMEYFTELLGDDNFNITNNESQFRALKNNRVHRINFIDLCYKKNLVFIESIKSPNIFVRYSLEEIASTNMIGLLRLKESFEQSENYEYAALAKKEIEYRIRNA